MDESRVKRTVDPNREKNKKTNAQEKKTKSETTASFITDPSLDSIFVVGRSFGKYKANESGYRLHECYSETAINPLPDSSKNLRDIIHFEGLHTIPSNSSFTSARSDVSDVFQKKIQDLEDALVRQNLVIHSLKKQLGQRELIAVNTISTETDLCLGDDDTPKLRDLERKMNNKDKKIKDLNKKLQESCKVREYQSEENKQLTHQVSLLNRQLQSMFEMIGKKNWNTIDPTEFAKYKNKTVELQSLVASLEQQKSELLRKIEVISFEVDSKERERNEKTRELVDYKNKSTLEMCKLINQIDSLQKEAQSHSQYLDSKITEAQNAMDEEIVTITQKLEEQYQKDMNSAIEKFHSDFERLAELPKTAIDKLLRLSDPETVDFIMYQKEWDKQQSMLEAKIESLQANHIREITQLKDHYESKIVFLKTQVEALLSQLKERKDIIDIFENELMIYKSNSSMNLLKASTISDDFSGLKELYSAEIFSQKQVYKLQLNIFEEKVRMLTEEILYHAKNEEIHMQELENAKKMAFAFREKYERLVFEWEERVEKDTRASSVDVEITPELDNVLKEFKILIESLKKLEEDHEEKIKYLEAQNDDERFSLLRDIEDYQEKLQVLENLQKTHSRLDETVQDLIKTVGVNYTKTVEALLMSHVTELSLKHLEFCASEKRHIKEIDGLKNDHEKELEELRQKIECLEDKKLIAESEFLEIRKISSYDEIEKLKKKMHELTTEYMKSEGMIAIKEETERALSDRIKELENIIRLKEESCQKELQDLSAKYIKAEVLSSAKDDVTRELEDKLNESEVLLEKSCEEVDRLSEICVRFGEKNSESFHPGDGGDFKLSSSFGNKYCRMKATADNLHTKLTETFEKMKLLEKTTAVTEKLRIDLQFIQEKNANLEESKNQILSENNKLKDEISKLEEDVISRDKILESQKEEMSIIPELKKKLETVKAERDEILFGNKLDISKNDEIQKRNEFLEERVKELTERINVLTKEMANNKELCWQEEVFIDLQEVRFLYEEKQETSTAQLGIEENLRRTNEELQKENESLRMELREREIKLKTMAHEELFCKFKNTQKELSNVIIERNELMNILKNLEKERDNLREDLDRLRDENYVIRARYEAKMEILAEKGLCGDDEATAVHSEIGRLTEYIKGLSSKLDVIKANNELLLTESHEHLKHNQNLVSELEEAWSQRYEIEDQLAKVRRENAMLNLHRRQLEETNKRISNLVSEGKPSVVSWIKIHETVENIVDEVLALKTSFSDSGSVSGQSTGFDVPNTNSDLKLMTDTLHAQLKNKTMLCDELIIQKETLEKELKNLESLLQEDTKSRKVAQSSCGRKRQPVLEKWRGLNQGKGCQSPQETLIPSESSHLVTLKRLKKHLESQAELEEAQFRENLKLEIKELKKEEEEEEFMKNVPLEECLKSIELKYEEEVVELTKEFQQKVEELRDAFHSEKEEKNAREKYEKEIGKLKDYFEEKWMDLERRYTEDYTTRKQTEINNSQTPEPPDVLEQYHSLLQEGADNEEKKKLKIENFLTGLTRKHDVELKSLHKKYKEAVSLLETKHESEVQKLQSVVVQLKESVMLALKKEEREGQPPEELDRKRQAEYEAKLEEEKKKLCDLLEDAKRRHEREISALEEFWTEKLSECETKCAIMKATGGGRKSKSPEGGKATEGETAEMNQTCPEEKVEEKKLVKYREGGSDNFTTGFPPEFSTPESLCASCLANPLFYKRMELKTDDDKLDVIQQRDTLEEMIGSMRNIITKLLTFISQRKSDLNITFDMDDTMYKSVFIDLDRTISDRSMASTSLAMDLSMIFQEIKDNSLLNSSDQVRVELGKCLKQVQKDATSLLALSYPENAGMILSDLIKKVEKEKNELEAKVLRVEEIQNEMKKEINMTKDRLSQWERNLEVVTEGYGEEIIEPKQIISLSDLKDKLKVFLTENCGQSPQDINLLEEICKEGDRLQQEWMKEKCDLQQQIDVADKQLHSLKKFIEEQAVEREQEREAFDKEISNLQDNLKAKERDSSLQIRTNREVGRLPNMSLADQSVETLLNQVKELTTQLSDSEKIKGTLETEFQNAVKKIWSLREVIQDLELQLAEVSERENNLKKKVEKLDGIIEEQSKVNRHLKEELETCRNQPEFKYSEHVKSLEEELMRVRHVADQVNPDSLNHLKANLREIEAILIKKTKDLEQVHVSSANVSCSSPSEDVSIRDHLDATRCSTPEEMNSNVHSLSMLLPVGEIDRVHEKLARHTRAEEVTLKLIQDLKIQLRNHRKAFEEIQTERDVLLEKVDVYLKENSSLKVRLEEQRCNAGLLQKQLNANLESQINRLEIDVEKLNEMCNDKDKQLREMKALLENTTKSLKIRETEVLNKSKEENTLITNLKTDLANALNENQKLEDKLEKTMEQLRETLKMPALIDSMIEEKNAEISRLEKEVLKLSKSNCSSFSSEEKQKRKIRFSEPESFSENISSISVQCMSDMRNCSDSFGDLRNSTFRSRRPVGCSTKLESISSIAPLQLSPRGADSLFNWKSSSPIGLMNKSVGEIPSKPDFEQMEEISKLHGEIESKQREISELHLEIDILKRQLVEVNQEVASAKSYAKEVQNEVSVKEEEIRKMKNSELSLHMTIESLKKNHAEEVEELHNKLSFEHGKVEKVYEEIKALEVKKTEIEESFLSLKEDYSEKINAERKTTEALVNRIRSLEGTNGELELRMASLERELENMIKESEYTIHTLSKEISDLKEENEKIRSASSQKANAEIQTQGEVCPCEKSLILEIPKTEGDAEPFNENLKELKTEFDKMAAVIGERDFNKKEAFLYAMAVRRLLSVVLTRVDELSKEVEAHMKKVMECSVDDLALKVQKELVISAKLDHQLLSSIEANGFMSVDATPQSDSLDLVDRPMGGDSGVGVPKPLGRAAMMKVAGLYKDLKKKMLDSEKERENLEKKISEQQKIIRLLEESLKKEKERILEEKERCSEDAKIMELLRVNLEKRLNDIKTKEKELRKEKQAKMALEKEMEAYKKKGGKAWESKKVMELNAQLESQKEKLVSMGQLLEEEKKKNQELRLAVEEMKLEKVTEKNAQKLMEGEMALLREQKDKFKRELLTARRLLHSRHMEIGLLKRKINLQEIDIKALTLSSDIHTQNPTETSSNAENVSDLVLNQDSSSPTLLLKTNKLSSRFQKHVKESSEMGETLLYLSQETEQMKDIIRKFEENSETKPADETLVPDFEVERKLWALEKGRLILDLESLRKEHDTLKEDLVSARKSSDTLKQENLKLKREMRPAKIEEVTTNQVENSFLQEQVSHLTRKYVRTESYRKALAWQKNYLLIVLQDYQRSEEEAWKKLGRRKRDGKRKGLKPGGRFRVVALAAVAIFRMRYIVKRWQRNAFSQVFSFLDAQSCNKKLAPLASVLNIYGDPVNPLSYQTQQIFHHSPSSQVLRTPPSRDTGPRSFSLDSKNGPERLVKFEYLKENLGVLKSSP